MRTLWKAAIVLSSVAGATIVTSLVRVWAGETMFVFFVAAALLSTWLGGWKDGAAAALLSALAVDWFFVPRVGSLRLTGPEEIARFVSFLLVTGVVVLLADGLLRARKRAE